jgi:hypothetical protein
MLKIIIIIIIILLLLFQKNNEMMENLDDNKKCYIENKFIDGEFKYVKSEITDNYNLNTIDIIDCNDNRILGSCRNINKECIDFVTQEHCDNYRMTFSTKTCRDPLPYTWIDKADRPVNKQKDNGEFLLFKKF